MATIKWIKITTDIFDDEKIKLIDAYPERDLILVVWFKLLVLAGKTNDNGYIYISNKIQMSDEMIATLFNRPLNSVRLALKILSEFEMIELNDHLCIVNWNKHQNVDGLEKIKKQNAERQKKFRENKKIEKLLENKVKNNSDVISNVTNNVTVTESNALDIEIDIDKESYHDHDFNNININKIKNLFEKFGINFSKKHHDVVNDLLKKNSVDFLIKHFTKQYEILSNNSAVKNVPAVFSKHLFAGTCEVDKVEIIEKEKHIEELKKEDSESNFEADNTIEIFKTLPSDKQEEIENKILEDKEKPVFLGIKRNSEAAYYKMLAKEIRNILESEKLIL